MQFTEITGSEMKRDGLMQLEWQEVYCMLETSSASLSIYSDHTRSEIVFKQDLRGAAIPLRIINIAAPSSALSFDELFGMSIYLNNSIESILLCTPSATATCELVVAASIASCEQMQFPSDKYSRIGAGTTLSPSKMPLDLDILDLDLNDSMIPRIPDSPVSLEEFGGETMEVENHGGTGGTNIGSSNILSTVDEDLQRGQSEKAVMLQKEHAELEEKVRKRREELALLEQEHRAKEVEFQNKRKGYEQQELEMQRRAEAMRLESLQTKETPHFSLRNEVQSLPSSEVKSSDILPPTNELEDVVGHISQLGEMASSGKTSPDDLDLHITKKNADKAITEVYTKVIDDDESSHSSNSIEINLSGSSRIGNGAHTRKGTDNYDDDDKNMNNGTSLEDESRGGDGDYQIQDNNIQSDESQDDDNSEPELHEGHEWVEGYDPKHVSLHYMLIHDISLPKYLSHNNEIVQKGPLLLLQRANKRKLMGKTGQVFSIRS